MLIYLCLAVGELLLGVQYSKYDQFDLERSKKWVWFFVCFLMWFVIGFRGLNVGTDTGGYYNHLLALSNYSFSDIPQYIDNDVGFYYVLKVLSMVSTSPLWFTISTSFLSCLGVWDYVRCSAKNPVMALFYFITLTNFWFMMTGIRQSFAISLCLISFRYIEKRKPISFAVVVFFAFMCHKSALIFAPMYFIANMEVGKKSVLWSAVLTAIGVYGYEYFLEYINDYLDYDYGVENVTNGGINYLVFLAIILIAYNYRKRWMRRNSDTASMNTSIIATMLWTFRLFSRTAERPSLYFQPSLSVVISNALAEIHGTKNENALRILFAIVALTLYIKRSLGMPYVFFWQ